VVLESMGFARMGPRRGPRTALELAAQLGGDFLPLGDPALLGIYHRQQELSWTEHLVERIENELEAAGVLGRPERVPAMSFLDLTGYTHLTEQQGDATAAALAETLAVLVNRSSREHGGVPVKLALVSGAVIPQSVAALGAVLSSDDYGRA
jgi:class 3 adenylate cyclase